MESNIFKNNDRTVIVLIKFHNNLSVMKFDNKKELLKLAHKVKKLRTEKGVTQEDAYNDTGIHFGRIEQGKRDVSYTTLLKISIYFELSLQEFFGKGF